MASFSDRERFFPQTGPQSTSSKDTSAKDEARKGLSELEGVVKRMGLATKQMNKLDTSEFLDKAEKTLGDVREVIASPENAKKLLSDMELNNANSQEVHSKLNMKEELQQSKQSVTSESNEKGLEESHGFNI